MGLFLDLKKVFSSKLFKFMQFLLIAIAILDPIFTYYVSITQIGFEESIGTNPFQFWLLMNSSGWGHAIFFALFFIFPIVSTGFVFFHERCGSVFISIISKETRKKYFINKCLAVFVFAFINFFAMFMINFIMTHLLFDSNNLTEQYFFCVPKDRTFAKIFYDISPTALQVMYAFLNALVQGILAVWVVTIQMIGRFKKIYTAFAVPFVIFYVTEYVLGVVMDYFQISGYNPLVFIQPRAASGLITIITTKNVISTLLIMFVITIILFIWGIKKNEDIL